MKPQDGEQRRVGPAKSANSQDGLGQAIEVSREGRRPHVMSTAAASWVSPPTEPGSGEVETSAVIVGGPREARGIGISPSRPMMRRLIEAFGSYSAFVHQMHDLARSTRQWVSLYVDLGSGRLRLDAAPSPAPTAIIALDARPLRQVGARQITAWLWAHTQVIDWHQVARLLEAYVNPAPVSGHNEAVPDAEEEPLPERRPPMARVFDPANKERLLDPGRLEWNHPDKILAYLNLGEHTNFVEIGCGPGYFCIPAARLIGAQGKVYAADLSEEMLAACAQNAHKEGVADRIELVLATGNDEYPLTTHVADAVLLANVYHEVDPASNFLHEVRRIVKPGGLVLVVDWLPEETPVGPPLHERLNPQDVTEEFTQAGFFLAGTVDVGPYHYGLKFYLPLNLGDERPTQNNNVP